MKLLKDWAPKVFCTDCKNHFIDNDYRREKDRCSVSLTVIDGPIKQTKVYQACEVINKDNKCLKFKKKWWKIF